MGKERASTSKIVGTRIAGRFEVKRKLAAGGMGVVYLGEQVPLGRPVAIKILDTQQLDDERAENFGERFFLEAAAVAKLQHPNTITIYDYGKTDEEVFFYAMEFVDGASMSHAVHSNGPLPPEAVVHVGMQICASLREAHQQGMIHRDLKPGNIMLTERHDDPFFVKILDFGLVKVMGQDEVGAELTQSGMLLGSPRYMAPEQVLRFELDGRVDIYSLGGVLYYALTGFPPFQHESQFAVLRAQVEEEAPPFREVFPECKASARLEALVFKCLAKERRDRPQDMAEVARELIECAREMGVEEPSLSGSGRVLSSPSHEVALEEMREEATVAAKASAAAAEDPVEASQIRERDSMEAEPATRERKTLLVWVLACLALVAAGLGVFFVVAFGGGTETAAETAVEPTVAEEVAEEEEVAEAPTPPAETAMSTLRIETTPTGARVRRGDRDLGDAPFSFEIPHGEEWELTVSLEGHEERTVLASAGRDVLHVRLSPVPAEEEEEPAHRRRGRRGTRGNHTQDPTGSSDPPAEDPHFDDRGDLRHPWGHPR